MGIDFRALFLMMVISSMLIGATCAGCGAYLYHHYAVRVEKR